MSSKIAAMTSPAPLIPHNRLYEAGFLPYLWPFLGTLMGFVFYTIGDTLVKASIEKGFPFFAVIFFYGLGGIISATAYAAIKGKMHLLKTKRIHVHIGRSLIHLTGVYFAFYALGFMELADAYTLFLTAPIFITILSALFHKEQIGITQWGAVILCFIGTLIFFRPGFQDISFIMFCPLIGAIFFSCSVLIVRHYKGQESPVTFNFYFGVIACLINLPLLFWFDVHFTLLILVMVSCAALVSMSTNLLFLWAHQNAPSVLISPLQYTQLLWGSLIGYILWGHLPDLWSITAMSIIALSGIYLLVSAHVGKGFRIQK